MTSTLPRRSRIWAVLSLALLAATVVVVVVALVGVLWALALALLGLALAAAGGWWVVTEQMPRRGLGLLGVVLGLGVVVVAVVAGLQDGLGRLVALGLAVALGAASGVCARLAVRDVLHAMDLTRVFPAFTPTRPVLICNPRSGGGKVDRFGIAEKAVAMGVEVVMLEPGLDLEQLARDAVARGADCLGMAGGDGSQALVASIAVEHDLPFVCISAGTRNHFALDLGLDREDPSTGLAAFTAGVCRRVDYATVGSRLFVNNVSLGVYAEIVQSDDYRDAKLVTTQRALPELLGRRAEPFDLQFTDAHGNEVQGSFAILVSNNPYVLGPSLDVSQRRSLTTGRLGVFAVSARTGAQAARLVTREALGRGARDPGVHQFTTQTFQVRSHSGTARAGVDGEALTLPTPADFVLHPAGLTVLVPPDNPTVAATAHYRDLGVRGLWDIAWGRDALLSGSDSDLRAAGSG
jgi:diacylglycerol kinase family enzyme